MQIITNNKPRVLVAYADLPAKAQVEFDYVLLSDAYSPRFVQYKGAWYDVYDSQYTGELGFDQFKGWHGIVSDSFFSGVLFKWVDDGEAVIVGRYFSPTSRFRWMSTSSERRVQ